MVVPTAYYLILAVALFAIGIAASKGEASMSGLQLQGPKSLWLRITASAIIICSNVLVLWMLIENKPFLHFVLIINFLLMVVVIALFVPKNSLFRKRRKTEL